MVYYAVSGSNAFGVYDDFEKIENVKEFIRDFSVTKCRALSLAFCHARDIYNDFQEGKGVDDIFCGDSSEIKLNRVLFSNEIRELNATK